MRRCHRASASHILAIFILQYIVHYLLGNTRGAPVPATLVLRATAAEKGVSAARQSVGARAATSPVALELHGARARGAVPPPGRPSHAVRRTRLPPRPTVASAHGILGHPLGEVRDLRVEDPHHDRVIRELVPPLHYPIDPDVAEGARGEPEEGQDDPTALHGGHLEGGAVDGRQ